MIKKSKLFIISLITISILSITVGTIFALNYQENNRDKQTTKTKEGEFMPAVDIYSFELNGMRVTNDLYETLKTAENSDLLYIKAFYDKNSKDEDKSYFLEISLSEFQNTFPDAVIIQESIFFKTTKEKILMLSIENKEEFLFGIVIE